MSELEKNNVVEKDFSEEQETNDAIYLKEVYIELPNGTLEKKQIAIPSWEIH